MKELLEETQQVLQIFFGKLYWTGQTLLLSWEGLRVSSMDRDLQVIDDPPIEPEHRNHPRPGCQRDM